jgi:glutamate racemase
MSELNLRNQPIGVFDSGLGGLTVVKELIHDLPNEDIIYYGDTARVPYGTKSRESIIRFSFENTEELLKYNVKMVVVACNTSTSYALLPLRDHFDVPIIGVIQPGAQQAVRSTKNNRIGVIATSATVNSQEYTKTILNFNNSAKVFSQACPLFVPLVEEGWLDNKVAYDVASQYLAAMKRNHIDTLILGCTHYPLLKPVLKKVMGKRVTLVDSAKAVVNEVKEVLKNTQRFCDRKRKGQYKFLITDKPQEFQKIAHKFLGTELSKEIKYV